MFRPAALCIGLRYIRAKKGSFFISFISLISILGIALGVTVLITVLSVVNGFDREIKRQLFGMIAPITVSDFMGPMENWQPLIREIKQIPNVTGVAPLVNGQAMLIGAESSYPVLINGILPEAENQISALANNMVQGNLLSLKPNQAGIILGEELANQLNVHVGDDLTIAVQKKVTQTSIVPEFKRFIVKGIFKAGGGGFSFDTRYAFIHLTEAQELFHLGSAISMLHVNINDIYLAPKVTLELQDQLERPLRIGNWTQQLGDFFENIRMTKTMMFFIFIMIIAVAVFNLICTMVMIVKSKQGDIAILRTIGATPATILVIFLVQGALIGVGGTLLGIVAGVSLSYRVGVVSTWIQHFFNTKLMSSNIYFVDYLPSELQWNDIYLISLVAFSLSLVATLYPAWRASRVDPADVLRYE